MSLPEAEQLALARLLERTVGHGFRLVVIELRTPAERDALLDWLRERVGPVVRTVEAEGDFAKNPLAALEALEPPLGEGAVLVVTGLERVEQGDEGPRAGALQALNVQRDTLVTRFPCFWIVILHPRLRRQAQAVAPDFLDFASLWVEAVPETEAPRASPAPFYEGRAAAWAPVHWDGISTSAQVLLEAAWEHLGRYEVDRVRDLVARVRLAEGHDPRALACVQLVETWLDGERRNARELANQFASLAGSADLTEHLRAVARVGEARAWLRAGDLPRMGAAIDEASLLGDQLWQMEAEAQRVDLLIQMSDFDQALHIAQDVLLPRWQQLGSERDAAITLGTIAAIYMTRGAYDEALRILREEGLPVYERLGDLHSRASTLGQIALILASRGDYDEALRIRREEQLPVYEHLGDIRSKAAALDAIAEIVFQLGDYPEALRIRREEVVPVVQYLGDVLSMAGSLSGVAVALHALGDHADALRIQREEVLPVYERLGDARNRARVLGRIADILHDRGEIEEALRIRREEQLPVYEQLGDIRSQAITLGKIANVLIARGEHREALRINRERVLPTLIELGEARETAVALYNTALCHLGRNIGADRRHAVHLLDEAIELFRRLGLKKDEEETRQFRKTLR